MKSLLLGLVCCFMVIVTQAQTANTMPDLPPNPQAGQCYIKCFPGGGTKGEWKNIDCVLIEHQKLEVLSTSVLSRRDKKTLDKVLKRFIKNGYTLQLDSYYTSSKSIEDNLILSRERAITVANYLVEKGLSPNDLKVNVMGQTDQKTGFWYRAINGNPAK